MAGSLWFLGVVSVALLGALGPRVARAADSLEGDWDTPLGQIRIEQTPAGYLGKLQQNAPLCGFSKGAEVLRGRLSDELFTGELRVCYLPACDAPEAWLLAMAAPVEGGTRLVGALAPGGAACPNVVTRGRPFAFARRVQTSTPAVVAQLLPRAAKLAAQKLLREASALSAEGQFETARRKLARAEALDPSNPEILKEIGITQYALGDYESAQKYYLWALKYDPGFVVAHYNLACVRARRGNRRGALGSLRRAVELGFNALDAMNADPDLDSIRGEPDYQEILRLARDNSARRR